MNGPNSDLTKVGHNAFISICFNHIQSRRGQIFSLHAAPTGREKETEHIEEGKTQKEKKNQQPKRKRKKKREELPSPLTELCYPRLLVLFKKPTAFESTLGLFNSRRSNDVNQAVGPNPLMQLSLCIISIPALEAGMIFILASFSSSSLCLSLLKP